MGICEKPATPLFPLPFLLRGSLLMKALYRFDAMSYPAGMSSYYSWYRPCQYSLSGAARLLRKPFISPPPSLFRTRGFRVFHSVSRLLQETV